MHLRRSALAGVGLATLACMLSSCVFASAIEEEQAITSVASDLNLDDLGGPLCEEWHHPGPLAVGDVRRLNLLLLDVETLSEMQRRLEEIGFERQYSPVPGKTEFVRNDLPEPGDYVAARLIEHPQFEVGEQISTFTDRCQVPPAGAIEIEIFV